MADQRLLPSLARIIAAVDIIADATDAPITLSSLLGPEECQTILAQLEEIRCRLISFINTLRRQENSAQLGTESGAVLLALRDPEIRAEITDCLMTLDQIQRLIRAEAIRMVEALRLAE